MVLFHQRFGNCGSGRVQSMCVNLCVCVCMYVCMCIYVCMCVYECMYVCVRMYVCVCMYVSMCVKKVKVKWSRYRPGVAQSMGRGIALLLHDRGTRRGWVVSSTPRPHFAPGKDLVPIVQEAGWAPGPVWTGRKSRPHRDSIPDLPARSQALYRLSYPAQVCMYLHIHIYIHTYTHTCSHRSRLDDVSSPSSRRNRTVEQGGAMRQ